MKKSISVITSATVGVVLASCASHASRPIAELSRASTLIDVATRAGAQQFAAADIERARDKLRFANEAADNKKQERARRFAQQAAVDAEVATARARSAKAQNSAQEVRDSIQALRNETTEQTVAGSNSGQQQP